MRVFCNNYYGKLRACAMAIPRRGAFSDLSDPFSMLLQELPDWDKVRWELLNYRNFLIRHGVHVLVLNYNQYPNQVFVRDLGVVVDDLFYLGKPKYQPRWGEEEVLNVELLVPHDIKTYQLASNFEGADVLVEPEMILAAIGNRTSSSALRELLQHSISPRQTVSIQALPEGVPQHLLGHKQIVAKDVLLSRHRLNNQTFGFSHVIRLEETEEVVKGFAANVAVLGPGVVAMPTGCPATRRLYEDNRLTVYELPMSEVHKMGGGLTCVTLPLVRDEGVK